MQRQKPCTTAAINQRAEGAGPGSTEPSMTAPPLSRSSSQRKTPLPTAEPCSASQWVTMDLHVASSVKIATQMLDSQSPTRMQFQGRHAQGSQHVNCEPWRPPKSEEPANYVRRSSRTSPAAAIMWIAPGVEFAKQVQNPHAVAEPVLQLQDADEAILEQS